MSIANRQNYLEQQQDLSEFVSPQHSDVLATRALIKSTGNATPGSTKSSRVPTPRHIWHIQEFLRCPIIGTCLSLSEQKQILKKDGVQVKKMDEYDIHSRLVETAGTGSQVSARIEALLNRKYRREMEMFSQLSEKELLAVWNRQFAAGDYAALLWSAAVRPDLSENAVQHIFADLHMQMHTLSEQSRRDRQTLTRLEKENRKLCLHIKELKKTYRQVLKANRLLKDEHCRANRKCTFLEKERRSLIEQTENQSDRTEKLATLTHENEALCSELEGLAKSVRFLQQAYDELEADNRSLRRKCAAAEPAALPEAVSTAAAGCSTEKKCSACDLCQRRVLIVGGIKKMENFYRKVVETCGGTFEYHDGYMHAGRGSLESKVRRADLVLCPVNCNSHGACLVAKRLGKKYGKTVRMLAGSSLSSISQSLWKFEKEYQCENRLTH